jgi:hypothetical protein
LQISSGFFGDKWMKELHMEGLRKAGLREK